MARIGINAQLLTFTRSYRNAGSSAFIYHLLTNLPRLPTRHKFVVFSNAGRENLPLGEASNISVRPSRLDTEQPAQRIFWEQAILPLLLQTNRLDLIHGTLNVLPLARRIPGVLTIHDLAFLLFPDRFLPGRRRYLTNATTWSARGARKIIASSHNTKRDIVRLLGVPEEHVRVVHLGVEERFRVPPTADQLAAFRQANALPPHFFLYLGTLEPRKNLVRLLDAYQEARARGVDWPLVLVGGKGWLYEEIFQRVRDLDLSDHVRFPGYALYEDIPLWYNAASAFVYPSLYEGFGLPVAEAMASGCPVITARNSSLVEVAGDATILIDGEDQQELAQALCSIAGDQSLRADLSDRGRAQSAQFTWPRTAASVLSVYDDALREL